MLTLVNGTLPYDLCTSSKVARSTHCYGMEFLWHLVFAEDDGMQWQKGGAGVDVSATGGGGGDKINPPQTALQQALRNLNVQQGVEQEQAQRTQPQTQTKNTPQGGQLQMPSLLEVQNLPGHAQHVIGKLYDPPLRQDDPELPIALRLKFGTEHDKSDWNDVVLSPNVPKKIVTAQEWNGKEFVYTIGGK
eukprot:g10176.t1